MAKLGYWVVFSVDFMAPSARHKKLRVQHDRGNQQSNTEVELWNPGISGFGDLETLVNTGSPESGIGYRSSRFKGTLA